MSNTIIDTSMFALLTNEGILAMKAACPNDTNLATLLDSILATRKAEAEAKIVADKFTKAISDIVAKLPNPPKEVYNFYGQFKLVEIEDTSKPKEDCTIVVDGKNTIEKRHPMLQVQKWIVTVNHVCNMKNGTSTTSDSANSSHKRAITVKKMEADKLVIVGTFRNGAEACKFLKLDTNGDSANRVLGNNKYYTEAYTGNDYTVK
jgi:hypothetical protein